MAKGMTKTALVRHMAEKLEITNKQAAAGLELLADTAQPADPDLPDTGIGLALERTLAPIFIRGRDYGTRASTLAYARTGGGLVLLERRFGRDGVDAGETRLDF